MAGVSVFAAGAWVLVWAKDMPAIPSDKADVKTKESADLLLLTRFICIVASKIFS
jgi:hypothetical protein